MGEVILTNCLLVLASSAMASRQHNCLLGGKTISQRGLQPSTCIQRVKAIRHLRLEASTAPTHGLTQHNRCLDTKGATDQIPVVISQQIANQHNHIQCLYGKFGLALGACTDTGAGERFHHASVCFLYSQGSHRLMLNECQHLTLCACTLVEYDFQVKPGEGS